ncbi:hypothetical protein ASPTUDRAFT_42534 [Aspergillus tubingensis CBS 134.48]|uniref:Uncharacterized protein n=1 Tax=Aspergillus tubingensis (strain CBS 134.48) TaxID=767770 RepID=A0A1L9N346_ASPTC|nr:hypothetical protein ASPTUDRAFT_42534 [Aspergillus tubingensis CBS 134.48]
MHCASPPAEEPTDKSLSLLRATRYTSTIDPGNCLACPSPLPTWRSANPICSV